MIAHQDITAGTHPCFVDVPGTHLASRHDTRTPTGNALPDDDISPGNDRRSGVDGSEDEYVAARFCCTPLADAAFDDDLAGILQVAGVEAHVRIDDESVRDGHFSDDRLQCTITLGVEMLVAAHTILDAHPGAAPFTCSAWPSRAVIMLPIRSRPWVPFVGGDSRAIS